MVESYLTYNVDGSFTKLQHVAYVYKGVIFDFLIQKLKNSNLMFASSPLISGSNNGVARMGINFLDLIITMVSRKK